MPIFGVGGCGDMGLIGRCFDLILDRVRIYLCVRIGFHEY